MIKEEDNIDALLRQKRICDAVKNGVWIVLLEEAIVRVGDNLYRHTISCPEYKVKWHTRSKAKTPLLGNIQPDKVILTPQDGIFFEDGTIASGFKMIMPPKVFFSLVEGFDGVDTEKKQPTEQVQHPFHYAWLKDLCGVEPIDICRHFDFAIGNALKYLMRKGKVDGDKTEKEKRVEDLRKAVFYIQDEIKLLQDGKM